MTVRGTVTVLSIAFTALASVGCAQQENGASDDLERMCLPEDGCDGIASVSEVPVEERALGDALTAARPGWCVHEDDPRVTYVATDTAVCGEVAVKCEAGWQSVPSACGCGCVFADETDDAEFRSVVGPQGGFGCVFNPLAC